MRASFHALFLPFMCWAAGFMTAFAIAAAIDGLSVRPLFAGAAVLVNVTTLALWFRRASARRLQSVIE